MSTSSSCTKELHDLEHAGWIEIEGVVDSGAANIVAPPSVLPQMFLLPAKIISQKKGRGWRTLERRLNEVTNDLQKHSVTYQMVDVTRPMIFHFKNRRHSTFRGFFIWMDGLGGESVDRTSNTF